MEGVNEIPKDGAISNESSFLNNKFNYPYLTRLTMVEFGVMELLR